MKLVMRPMQREYAPIIQQIRDAQTHHLRTGWKSLTESQQLAWYDNLNPLTCYIKMFYGTKETDRIREPGTMGYAILDNIDWHDRRAELGGVVETPVVYGNLLFEAWQEIIKHAFENMGLVRIDAVCYSNATERISLIEKLGFKKEGVKVGCHYWDGIWHDEILYGLTSWSMSKLEAE